MTQEEKDLLLRDLCARLPWGVKVQYDNKIYSIDYVSSKYEEVKLDILDNYTVGLSDIKPYLRPMESMTEQEKKEFEDFCVIDEDAWMNKGIKGYINQSIIMSNGIDWLNMYHFDYNRKYDKKDRKWKSMIEMGLALEAPKDMYDFQLKNHEKRI